MKNKRLEFNCQGFLDSWCNEGRKDMMGNEKAITKITDLNTSISDGYGCYGVEYKNVEEILEELRGLYKNFSTHAMNEHTLFLQGEKHMLGKIIDYLEKL